MHRDIGLNKVGLQRLNKMNYNMGDFLFHAITYLLKCSNRSKLYEEIVCLICKNV